MAGDPKGQLGNLKNPEPQPLSLQFESAESLTFSDAALVHVEKPGSDQLGLREVDLLTPAPSRKPVRAPNGFLCKP